VERHAVRPRDQFLARLVEADVTIGANAEQLQIDAAAAVNLPVVARTFRVQVVGGTVQEMDIRRLQVDVLEQMLVHEPPEAAGMGRIDARQTHRD
jgi:hypothetical protein